MKFLTRIHNEEVLGAGLISAQYLREEQPGAGGDNAAYMYAMQAASLLTGWCRRGRAGVRTIPAGGSGLMWFRNYHLVFGL
jgi:hypothetical protein